MRLRGWLPLVVFAQACAGDMGDGVGEVRGSLAEVTWTAEVGVTATGNDLVKSAPEATWGAGAASVQSLGGDGYVEFTTAESTAAKMAGLSNGNSDPTYQDIDFALYLGANGTVAVREGGQPRGTFGAYAAGDLFRVQVLGGVVTYWRNDALLYTSAAAPVFPLLVDTSLRTPGATISDAVIETEMFWTGRINAAADGNDLVKTAPDPTWNAGAISVNALSDDGHVEFTTGENTTAKMAGLSNGDGGTGFDDIDFAILLGANGVVGVREGGVSRGTFGPYAAGDLFRVAVTAGVVTYARNGTVFYTSGAAPTSPLLLDTSLRTPGATILDAQVVDAAETATVFDNSDGTFVWDWDCGCVTEPPDPPAWLNPSRAADQQSGLASARSILFFKQDPSVGMSTPGEFAFQGREAPGGLAIAAGPSFVIPGNEEGYDRGVIPPLSKSPGDVVGPADDWRQRVLTAHFVDLSQSYGPSQTWFQDGIIGVRFPMADGIHYGFIELDYIPNDFNSWYSVYRPIRWGYNPVPDQPLVIPP